MRARPGLLSLALAGSAVLASCSQGVAEDRPAPRSKRQPPGPPSVSGTISLPGDDGRVHIVSIPGRRDTQRCLVHVGPASSSIACLPEAEFVPLVENER